MMKAIIAKTKCHVTTHDNPQKRVDKIKRSKYALGKNPENLTHRRDNRPDNAALFVNRNSVARTNGSEAHKIRAKRTHAAEIHPQSCTQSHISTVEHATVINFRESVCASIAIQSVSFSRKTTYQNSTFRLGGLPSLN